MKKLPCHRVIRSDGTLGGYNRGTKAKSQILEQESRIITDFL
ncbi:MAG: MGMT family protein [Patescibacteria group bacterium]